MAVWIFFGVEEDGAGTGAGTFGGRDVAVSARGALDGGAAGAGAIGATAQIRGRWAERRSGWERSVPFSAAPECRLASVRRILRSSQRLPWTFGSNRSAGHRHNSGRSRWTRFRL